MVSWYNLCGRFSHPSNFKTINACTFSSDENPRHFSRENLGFRNTLTKHRATLIEVSISVEVWRKSRLILCWPIEFLARCSTRTSSWRCVFGHRVTAVTCNTGNFSKKDYSFSLTIQISQFSATHWGGGLNAAADAGELRCGGRDARDGARRRSRLFLRSRAVVGDGVANWGRKFAWKERCYRQIKKRIIALKVWRSFMHRCISSLTQEWSEIHKIIVLGTALPCRIESFQSTSSCKQFVKLLKSFGLLSMSEMIKRFWMHLFWTRACAKSCKILSNRQKKNADIGNSCLRLRM